MDEYCDPLSAQDQVRFARERGGMILDLKASTPKLLGEHDFGLRTRSLLLTHSRFDGKVARWRTVRVTHSTIFTLEIRLRSFLFIFHGLSPLLSTSGEVKLDDLRRPWLAGARMTRTATSKPTLCSRSSVGPQDILPHPTSRTKDEIGGADVQESWLDRAVCGAPRVTTMTS